ncbi:MAG: lipopolysaccharide export system permease protein [Hyphomicrobiaceae bacterium]
MSLLGRYVAMEFLRVFALAMAASCGIYLVVDVFERMPSFLDYDPPISAIIAYFALKLPWIIADVYPAASLLAVLIALGMMTRNREILAARACGISTWQLAAPLVGIAFLTSIGDLAWNEIIVPSTYTQSRFVNDVVIKKKDQRGDFNASTLWFQASEGFYNLDFYDAEHRRIQGLTLYKTSADYRIAEVIEVPSASWQGDRWVPKDGIVKRPSAGGGLVATPLETEDFPFAEPPDELAARKRAATEFSFRQLRRQIAVLESKGLDADEFWVDLHRKLAWPFSGFVTVLVGFPLAVRGGRRAGVAQNIGLGLLVGLGYWVVTAVALSAGTSGAIHPALAAWTANLVFTAIAAILYLGTDGV